MGRTNEGPKLHRAKNGYHYIRETINGRTRDTSTRTKDLGEARKVLAMHLLKLANAVSPAADSGGQMTVGQAFAYFYKYHIEPDLVSKDPLQAKLKIFADFVGADTPIGDLPEEVTIDYAKERKQTKTRTGGYVKSGTILTELVNVKVAFNFCVKKRKLDSRKIPIFHYPEPCDPRQRWLTRAEAERLLEAARHWHGGGTKLPPIYLLTTILLMTGRRRRAVETLAWKYVDLRNKVIDFRGNRPNETSKKRGIVPISTSLYPILDQAYRERKTDYVLGDPDPERSATFKRMALSLGWDDVTAHTLRHTFGSWLAQNGHSLLEIAHAMDCTEATAERNYLHLTDQHKRATIEALIPDDFKTHTNRNPMTHFAKRKRAA